MENVPTPITDAAAWRTYSGNVGTEVVNAEVARELERQVVRLKDELSRVSDALVEEQKS